MFPAPPVVNYKIHGRGILFELQEDGLNSALLCIGLPVWFTLFPLPVLFSYAVELCFREK